MPTRFNSNSRPKFGVTGLPSGYEGPAPSGITLPPVGIEDADAALFKLFDKEIPFQVSTSDKNREELKKVPVVFSAAEKWALAKRQRALRDKTGSLILPLITVVRTTIQQAADEDISGRGINQQTGEIVIKRRLDNSDRGYQGLINRLFLNHQTNLAVPTGTGDDGQLTTNRLVGDLVDDPTVQDGGFLVPDRKKNIYETLVIPAPQFYTAVYEVTFWTQYTVQMFQLIELLISSFLPQGNAWRLDTSKGYWFVATVDGNVYNAENNFEDMSQEERMIKYKFTVKLPGYILATRVPGAPVPVKRYISSPTISFDIGVGAGEQLSQGDPSDMLLGADDPTLPLNDTQNRRRDQRRDNRTRLYPSGEQHSSEDPALKRDETQPGYKKITTINRSGKLVTKYVRVVTTNRFTGETVYSPDTDLGGLNIVVVDD